MTEHAKLDLCASVIQSIGKQEKLSCMFLDFAKAFDSVDHKILLKRLDYYGLRGIALKWFESYFVNGKQAVKIGLNYSSFQTVDCSVPQGSVHSMK